MKPLYRLFKLVVFVQCFGSFFNETSQAERLCSGADLRRWGSVIFEGRDRAKDFIAHTFNGSNIKKFDLDLYLKTKEELNLLEALPTIPERARYEEHLAWLESAQTRALAKSKDQTFVKTLPTIDDVIQSGTPRQKRALAQWSKKYGQKFEEKFTRAELKKSATELSLILNDSRLDLGSYTNLKLENSLDFVRTSTHARHLDQGLMAVLGKKNLLQKPELLDQVTQLIEKTPVKWSISGVTNTVFTLSSKYISTGVLVSLPKHQIARIAARDMALLVTEGFEKQGAAMALKYAPKVSKQVFYNSVKNIMSDLSWLSVAYFAGDFVKSYLDYDNEIDAQKYRRDVITPVVSPSPH